MLTRMGRCDLRPGGCGFVHRLVPGVDTAHPPVALPLARVVGPAPVLRHRRQRAVGVEEPQVRVVVDQQRTCPHPGAGCAEAPSRKARAGRRTSRTAGCRAGRTTPPRTLPPTRPPQLGVLTLAPPTDRIGAPRSELRQPHHRTKKSSICRTALMNWSRSTGGDIRVGVQLVAAQECPPRPTRWSAPPPGCGTGRRRT